MHLTPGELTALRNLLAKQDGQPVDFINIGDAAALTAYGLAVRTPQGWSITDAGRAHLRTDDLAAAPRETGDNILRGPGSKTPAP